MIYLLTGIGLTPGGRSTIHIYAQTIHNTHTIYEVMIYVSYLNWWNMKVRIHIIVVSKLGTRGAFPSLKYKYLWRDT